MRMQPLAAPPHSCRFWFRTGRFECVRTRRTSSGKSDYDEDNYDENAGWSNRIISILCTHLYICVMAVGFLLSLSPSLSLSLFLSISTINGRCNHSMVTPPADPTVTATPLRKNKCFSRQEINSGAVNISYVSSAVLSSIDCDHYGCGCGNRWKRICEIIKFIRLLY